MSNETPCRPIRNLDRSYSKGGHAMRIARQILTERDGPRQPGEVCRHECSNDSTRPSGFVCSEHTRWGTYSENNGIDKTPEARARGPKAAGKAPTAGGQTQSQCPHCDKVGQTAVMYRWHFDNCKRNPILALIIDDNDDALRLIYSRIEAV